MRNVTVEIDYMDAVSLKTILISESIRRGTIAMESPFRNVSEAGRMSADLLDRVAKVLGNALDETDKMGKGNVS